MAISPETITRLNNFKQSEKYNNLSPTTKSRLDNFLGNRTVSSNIERIKPQSLFKTAFTPLISEEIVRKSPALMTAGRTLPGTMTALGPFMTSLVPPALREKWAAPQMSEETTPTNIASTLLLGAPKALKIAGAGIAATRGAGTKITASLLKRFVKLNKYDYMYGKKPLESLAKEGLVAKSIEDLSGKVSTRLKDLTDLTKSIVEKQDPTKHISLKRQNTLQPLYDLRKVLDRDPTTHAGAIQKVDNLISDLSGIAKGKFTKFNKLNLQEAYELRDRLKKLTRWEGGGYDNEINSALHKINHYVGEKIGTVYPQLKPLNYRISNLISVKDGIDKTMQQAKPMVDRNLWDLAWNLPVEPIRSPMLRTGVGKVISQKYPKIAGNIKKP